MTTLELIRDANGNALQIIPLSGSQDVVSTTESVQSTAIQSKAVRISAVTGDLRFLTGVDPTAVATSHFLADHQEIWIPINPGDKVAIFGATANISSVGS